MNAMILLTLLLSAHSTFAVAQGNPKDEKCAQPAALAPLETSVVGELRERVAREQDGARAFTFKFSPVWHGGQEASDLTVYFEVVKSDDSRRAYVAQYGVDANSCAPQFKRMQVLVAGEGASPGILDGSDGDLCNYGAGQEKIHHDVVLGMKWLFTSIMPGSALGNFAFTSVKRMNGTSDVVAFFEASRPGVATSAMIAQVKVDPVTCAARVIENTAFTWLLITY